MEESTSDSATEETSTIQSGSSPSLSDDNKSVVISESEAEAPISVPTDKTTSNPYFLRSRATQGVKRSQNLE